MSITIAHPKRQVNIYMYYVTITHTKIRANTVHAQYITLIAHPDKHAHVYTI